MNLTAHLSQLEDAQLVRQIDRDLMAYIFKHVLVQETTYASLLKHERQRLHRAVANTLEVAEPDRLDENAARLAQHFTEAGDDAKTLEYALRAGDYAAVMYANTEAIEHYAHALTLLARRGGTPQEYLNVHMRRGRALELAGEFELALDNYLALEQEGVRQGEPSLELAGILGRATIYTTPTDIHDPRQGEVLNARALELSRGLGDRTAECKTLWNLLLAAYFDLNPKLAVEYGERALALARELGLQEREAYILNDMSRPLISVGPISRSLACLDGARALFQAQNNLPMLADNLAATAETLIFAGEYAQGLDTTERAIELSRTINSAWNLAYSGFGLMIVNLEMGNLGRVFAWERELSALPGANSAIIFIFGTRAWVSEAYQILGNYERALALNRELEGWAAATYRLAVGWLRANVIRNLVALGELDAAEGKLEQAYQDKSDDYSALGPILLPIAEMELALARRDPERALRVGDRLLGNLERRDIHFFRAEVYLLMGKAHMQLQAWDDAVTACEKSCAYAEPLPSRRILWQTYAVWADAERGRGDSERAQSLLAQAREHILYIAAHAGSEANRELFMSRPDIQAAL